MVETVDLGFQRRQSPYYSGNVENIKRLLSQLGVGNDRLDTITEEYVEIAQGEIDDVIDMELRPVVAVPLIRITRGSRLYFPGNVQYIASRLVAKKIIDIEFSGVEPNNISASAVEMYKDAITELDKLKNGLMVGTNRLEGQRHKARNRYVSPTQPPSQPMSAPIEGSR